jgi:hypothetical protein
MAKVLKMPSHGHTAGIYADMSVDGPQIGTLVAVFDRAKNLPNRKTLGKQNPYCAARLGKEAKKTGTDMRGGQTPKWYVRRTKYLQLAIVNSKAPMLTPATGTRSSDSQFMSLPIITS